VAEEFSRLAREWKEATAFESSPARLALHPAYQRIIGLGRRALPLILAEPAEKQGDVGAMARLWLDWGHRQGHC
jgi:hypothetical protein